jgi:hypothetical protein
MMATFAYTVECASHGAMRRNTPMSRWECATAGCPARLPDEDVRPLVTAAPSTGEPVPLVVTP